MLLIQYNQYITILSHQLQKLEKNLKKCLFFLQKNIFIIIIKK